MDKTNSKTSTLRIKTARIFRAIVVILLLCSATLFTGCVSDEVSEQTKISDYQRIVSAKGPQKRDTDDLLDMLLPEPTPAIAPLEVTRDPNSEEDSINLSIKEALARAFSNNSEIRIVSFEPSIAKEEVSKATGKFDISLFGQLNSERTDIPSNSSIIADQKDARIVETGIKQTNAIGSEWSVSYGLPRNWDNLTTTTLNTRYEPILNFQIKQPLWRDGWEEVNLSHINISKLKYQAAMLSFRQKIEEVSANVITVYWTLMESAKNIEVQERLLNESIKTLEKVVGRSGIDASTVHIKQAETAVKSRQAALLQVTKRFADVQDTLTRMLSDRQLNLLEKFRVVPVSQPSVTMPELNYSKILETAMANNPLIQQAKLGIEIADINIEVAKNQKSPRLDLIAAAKLHGLNRGYGEANDSLTQRDYTTYVIGISYEYPLGNRVRAAEYRKRVLERSKAVSVKHNIADQIAQEIKAKIRMVETSYQQMTIQGEAAEASRIHLQALEDTESVRKTLTPEFLLVKLQSQESLANAEYAEIKAIADFNSAQVLLAQVTGTVLEMHQIASSMPLTAALE